MSKAKQQTEPPMHNVSIGGDPRVQEPGDYQYPAKPTDVSPPDGLQAVDDPDPSGAPWPAKPARVRSKPTALQTAGRIEAMLNDFGEVDARRILWWVTEGVAGRFVDQAPLQESPK